VGILRAIFGNLLFYDFQLLLQIGCVFLQPRLLLLESRLILSHEGIDVGVVLALLHQLLLNLRGTLEEKPIPLALHPIVEGKNLVELGDLGGRRM